MTTDDYHGSEESNENLINSKNDSGTNEDNSDSEVSRKTTQHKNSNNRENAIIIPLQDNELNMWRLENCPRYISRNLFKPYKGKHPSITEEVDENHCSDNVVWTIVNIKNRDVLPTTSPSYLLKLRAKDWMVKFLKQTKKIMKRMAEIHYLSTALSEPWNSLLRKTTEPQFADFKQLQSRLQNRTDEVAWNLKFDSPDARKLADDFMGECNLHYRDNKDARTGKSFLERIAMYAFSEVKRFFIPKLMKHRRGVKCEEKVRKKVAYDPVRSVKEETLRKSSTKESVEERCEDVSTLSCSTKTASYSLSSVHHPFRIKLRKYFSEGGKPLKVTREDDLMQFFDDCHEELIEMGHIGERDGQDSAGRKRATETQDKTKAGAGLTRKRKHDRSAADGTRMNSLQCSKKKSEDKSVRNPCENVIELVNVVKEKKLFQFRNRNRRGLIG